MGKLQSLMVEVESEKGNKVRVMVLRGAEGGSNAGNCVPDRAGDPIRRVGYRLENGVPKIECPPGCVCKVE